MEFDGLTEGAGDVVVEGVLGQRTEGFEFSVWPYILQWYSTYLRACGSVRLGEWLDVPIGLRPGSARAGGAAASTWEPKNWRAATATTSKIIMYESD